MKKSNNIQIGCHVSSAGGLWNAPKNAGLLGCETFQMFSRSPQGGPVSAITAEVQEKFTAAMQEAGIRDFVIHAPYIINFGSATPKTFNGSIAIVRGELERGSLLGARYVMFHPGSFKDLGEEAGMVQLKAGLTEVLQGYEGKTELLIEISAGAGSVAGDTFEELAEMVPALKDMHGFGGICYDTQHAFASGYDIRTKKAAVETFARFDEVVGKQYLRMSHVNDSKVEFGSHKDRHEHLDEGHIGKSGFVAFMEQVKKYTTESDYFPLILETEHEKVAQDIALLKKIREGA